MGVNTKRAPESSHAETEAPTIPRRPRGELIGSALVPYTARNLNTRAQYYAE